MILRHVKGYTLQNEFTKYIIGYNTICFPLFIPSTNVSAEKNKQSSILGSTKIHLQINLEHRRLNETFQMGNFSRF